MKLIWWGGGRYTGLFYAQNPRIPVGATTQLVGHLLCMHQTQILSLAYHVVPQALPVPQALNAEPGETPDYHQVWPKTKQKGNKLCHFAISSITNYDA